MTTASYNEIALDPNYGIHPPMSPSCEGVTGPCGCHDDVQAEPSRTAYHVPDCEHEECLSDPLMRAACYDSRDRNKHAWLCRACAEEYHANWDGMWNDYYEGLM